MWLKIKQEGQTAGFGPCFHLPGFHFGTVFLSFLFLVSHSQIEGPPKTWAVVFPAPCPSQRTQGPDPAGALGGGARGLRGRAGCEAQLRQGPWKGPRPGRFRRSLSGCGVCGWGGWSRLVPTCTVSFLGGGFKPTKIDYGKKGTLILTSRLEDLVIPSLGNRMKRVWPLIQGPVTH